MRRKGSGSSILSPIKESRTHRDPPDKEHFEYQVTEVLILVVEYLFEHRAIEVLISRVVLEFGCRGVAAIMVLG